jgi:hypothetical protein
VPGAEHLVREFSGVTEAAGGDLLPGLPHLSRQDSTGLPRYGGRAASLRGIASRHFSCGSPLLQLHTGFRWIRAVQKHLDFRTFRPVELRSGGGLAR